MVLKIANVNNSVRERELLLLGDKGWGVRFVINYHPNPYPLKFKLK